MLFQILCVDNQTRVGAFFGGILFDNYAHYDGLEVVDLAGGVRRVRSVSPERQT